MTIAQQLKIKDFPFIIKDKNSKIIYHEDSYGYWYKREYNANGNQIYFENSYGYWMKREYDVNGNQTYYEAACGYWYKIEYDANGNRVYFENSRGYIVDKRPKAFVEVTLEEIADKLGINVKQLRIKE